MKTKYLHSSFLKKPDDQYAITQRLYVERRIDRSASKVPIWLADMVGTLIIGYQYPVEAISRERISREIYWSRRLPKLEPYKTVAKLERKLYWETNNRSC